LGGVFNPVAGKVKGHPPRGKGEGNEGIFLGLERIVGRGEGRCGVQTTETMGGGLTTARCLEDAGDQSRTRREKEISYVGGKGCRPFPGTQKRGGKKSPRVAGPSVQGGGNHGLSHRLFWKIKARLPSPGSYKKNPPPPPCWKKKGGGGGAPPPPPQKKQKKERAGTITPLNLRRQKVS